MLQSILAHIFLEVMSLNVTRIFLYGDRVPYSFGVDEFYQQVRFGRKFLLGILTYFPFIVLSELWRQFDEDGYSPRCDA